MTWLVCHVSPDHLGRVDVLWFVLAAAVVAAAVSRVLLAARDGH